MYLKDGIFIMCTEMLPTNLESKSTKPEEGNNLG